MQINEKEMNYATKQTSFYNFSLLKKNKISNL